MKKALYVFVLLTLAACNLLPFDATGTYQGAITGGPLPGFVILNIIDRDGDISGEGLILAVEGSLDGQREDREAAITFTAGVGVIGSWIFAGTFSWTAFSGDFRDPYGNKLGTFELTKVSPLGD